MADARQSHSSIPLVSRLDHLDFIMKYLEGKQNLSRWGSQGLVRGGSERQSMPLDVAVREAYFKGSLMDRVATLEHRLSQICLEMESSSTSGTSSQTSGCASSSQGSKSEPSSSLPTFYIPNQVQKQESFIVHANKPEVQENSHKEEQGRKISNAVKQKFGKHRLIKDEKACKHAKKKVSPKWPHLKILGC